MNGAASLAEMGALVGEPARTVMLLTLMDGRALTAGELARASGVTPPTASGHLARLVDGRLLAMTAQGRHRYFRLASPEVARMIEGMLGMAGAVEAGRAARRISSGPTDYAMRRARQCYDHLAGEVAVRIADHLVASGYLDWNIEAALITPAGIDFLEELGIARNGMAGKRPARAFCRPCIDWSERRPHVAGAVGHSLLQLFYDRHWIRRAADSRAVVITTEGASALKRHFGIR